MKELRTIASKIPNTLFVQLQRYCEMECISASAFIKELVESEVSEVVPHNKAGRNVLEYNKKHDLFTWFIEYDDGERVPIARNVSASFVEDALGAITSELRARELYLQKGKPGSVPAPTKMKKVVK